MTFKKIIPFLLLIYSASKLFAPPPPTRIENMISEYRGAVSFKPRPVEPSSHRPTISYRRTNSTTPEYYPSETPLTLSSRIDASLKKYPLPSRTPDNSEIMRNKEYLDSLNPSTISFATPSTLRPPPRRETLSSLTYTPISREYTTPLPPQSDLIINSTPAARLYEPQRSSEIRYRLPQSSFVSKPKMMDTGTDSNDSPSLTELGATGNKISFNTGSPLASAHKKAQLIKLPQKSFGVKFNEEINWQFATLKDHVRNVLVQGLKYGKDYNIVLDENDGIAVLKLHIKGKAAPDGKKQKGISLIMIYANSEIFYYSAKHKKWISANASEGVKILNAIKKRVPNKRSNTKKGYAGSFDQFSKKASSSKKRKAVKTLYLNSSNSSDENDSNLDETESNKSSNLDTNRSSSQTSASSKSSILDFE